MPPRVHSGEGLPFLAPVDGDFGGTACWIGQNYGNLPWIGEPDINNYRDSDYVGDLPIWYDQLDGLHVYLDDGSGEFEEGLDARIGSASLFSAPSVATFSPADPEVHVEHGLPKTFFVVAELTDHASTHDPNSFSVSHANAGFSSATDAVSGRGLRQERKDGSRSHSR